MCTLLLFAPTQPGVKDDDDSSLGQALESCFPALEDGCWLLWNGLIVPLSYKYDLSILIRDVLTLVTQVRTTLTGHVQVGWASNTFQGQWDVAVEEGRVWVNAQWDSVSGQHQDHRLLKQALNRVNRIEMDQAEFIACWVSLLRVAQQALSATGYSSVELHDYDLLMQELAHHPA